MRYPHGIKVQDIAEEVRAYADDLAGENPDDIADEEGAPSGDIRLQIDDGFVTVHTGDASYDTDHSGYWGLSSVTSGASMRECRNVARDLIRQALDDEAEHVPAPQLCREHQYHSRFDIPATNC